MSATPDLAEARARPAPFAPGAPLWDDPHISCRMLAAHLDAEGDAASWPHARIDRCVAWLIAHLDLAPGTRVLDLGCGPGLFAIALARRGLRVTGVDLSRRSLDHAAARAAAEGLDVELVHGDFTALRWTGSFDVALQIYGELNTLSLSARGLLLAGVHRALRPGGRWVFDVSTPQLRARIGLPETWNVEDGRGFFKPGPHRVHKRGWRYPDDLHLDQFVTVEPDGTTCIYRTWYQDQRPARLRALLGRAGFRVDGLYGDLQGAPLGVDSEWIGAVTTRIEPC